MSTAARGSSESIGSRIGWVWVLSIAVWSFASLATGISSYLFSREIDLPMSFLSSLGLEASDILTYAPMTPFAYALALRYPLQRSNWPWHSLIHLGGGITFTAAHVLLRGATPYASWDSHAKEWVSALGIWQGAGLDIHWKIYEKLLISSSVEDMIFVYVPIVLIAHAVSYHQRFREGEMRKLQLESQLANARLEALKHQLQPHFLFNTLNSISSLMFTDVAAADRMMALLSDMLRMSLSSHGTQTTTLRDELEFVSVYLEIEKIRFEERLSVEFDIDPEALDAEVPHLMLQPLVENSVRHGVSRLSQAGVIRIVVARVAGELQILVKDNGPGLTDTQDREDHAGVGLVATRQRLATLFGERHTFYMRNAQEGGAEVSLTIPFTKSVDAGSGRNNGRDAGRQP